MYFRTVGRERSCLRAEVQGRSDRRRYGGPLSRRAPLRAHANTLSSRMPLSQQGARELTFRARSGPTMLVHEWRKFSFLESDLPVEMLPGASAREARPRGSWVAGGRTRRRSFRAPPQPPRDPMLRRPPCARSEAAQCRLEGREIEYAVRVLGQTDRALGVGARSTERPPPSKPQPAHSRRERRRWRSSRPCLGTRTTSSSQWPSQLRSSQTEQMRSGRQDLCGRSGQAQPCAATVALACQPAAGDAAEPSCDRPPLGERRSVSCQIAPSAGRTYSPRTVSK